MVTYAFTPTFENAVNTYNFSISAASYGVSRSSSNTLYANSNVSTFSRSGAGTIIISKTSIPSYSSINYLITPYFLNTSVSQVEMNELYVNDMYYNLRYVYETTTYLSLFVDLY